MQLIRLSQHKTIRKRIPTASEMDALAQALRKWLFRKLAIPRYAAIQRSIVHRYVAQSEITVFEAVDSSPGKKALRMDFCDGTCMSFRWSSRTQAWRVFEHISAC
jgi:hypothetical protein